MLSTIFIYKCKTVKQMTLLGGNIKIDILTLDEHVNIIIFLMVKLKTNLITLPNHLSIYY